MGSHLVRRTAVATAALIALVAATAQPAAARPDLVVTSTGWTDYIGFDPDAVVAGPGAQLRVVERTRTAGDDFAGRSSTRYLLRDSNGRTRALGSRPVEALAPGDSTRAVQDVFVTEAVAPGTYRLLACADGARRIRENSERNNCRVASGQLRVRSSQRDAVFIGGGAATGAIVEDRASYPLGALAVNRASGAQLTGAQVGLIGAGGAGTLSVKSGTEFGVILGITGTYNSGTGILTLTGTASAADYQAALRSVWVLLKEDDPPAALKLEVRVRDGAGFWSKRARQTFPVTPVNDPPVLASTRQETILQDDRFFAGGAVFDSDSRIDGAAVRIASGFKPDDVLVYEREQEAEVAAISGTYDSGTGVLTLTGDATAAGYQAALRSVRFTRAPGDRGGRTLELQVRDAQGAASATFLINIEALP